MRLVLLEEDEPLLKALVYDLEANGFSVTAYANAAPLLERPVVADCLIVDLAVSAARQLRLIARLRQLGIARPAILIVSDPSQNLRAAAADADVAIIEKPLVSGELRSQIARLTSG